MNNSSLRTLRTRVSQTSNLAPEGPGLVEIEIGLFRRWPIAHQHLTSLRFQVKGSPTPLHTAQVLIIPLHSLLEVWFSWKTTTTTTGLCVYPCLSKVCEGHTSRFSDLLARILQYCTWFPRRVGVHSHPAVCWDPQSPPWC